MNLFDYIKYQSIDLTNEEDLRTLPIQLIDILYFPYPAASGARRALATKVNVIAWRFRVEIFTKQYFVNTLTEYYKKNNTDESV